VRRRFVGNDAYARASSLYFTAKTASFASFEIVSQSPLALSALLIRKGEIPALRIGRSYPIPRTAADDYLARVLSPRSRSSPKPRAREVDELMGFLFPVGMMQ
jgi:hypothetical protein